MWQSAGCTLLSVIETKHPAAGAVRMQCAQRGGDRRSECGSALALVPLAHVHGPRIRESNGQVHRPPSPRQPPAGFPMGTPCLTLLCFGDALCCRGSGWVWAMRRPFMRVHRVAILLMSDATTMNRAMHEGATSSTILLHDEHNLQRRPLLPWLQTCRRGCVGEGVLRGPQFHLASSNITENTTIF